VRSSDTVGRLGGDEFVVLSENSFSGGGLGVVAERLLAVLREPFRLGDATRTTLSTSASIGIATGMGSSPEELLRNADIAMYRAKSMGKNCHVLFEPENARSCQEAAHDGDGPGKGSCQQGVLPRLPADR